MSETFLNKAQLTGLGPDARRTEILRAKGIAELDTRLTAVEAEITPWTDFTPTWTNYTRGNGTVFAQYRYVGQMLQAHVLETLGSTSVMGTTPAMTLPDGQTSKTGFPFFMPAGHGNLLDSGAAAYACLVRLTSATTVAPYYMGEGANPAVILASPAATFPYTWTTNDAMRLFIEVPID